MSCDEVNRYAFQSVNKNPIVLDFSDCKYLGEVHQLLKEKFGFPEYYGDNWDALWDCLDGLFDGRGAIKVEVYGFYAMNEKLQKACIPMLEIFDEVEKKTPNLHFEISP